MRLQDIIEPSLAIIPVFNYRMITSNGEEHDYYNGDLSFEELKEVIEDDMEMLKNANINILCIEATKMDFDPNSPVGATWIYNEDAVNLKGRNKNRQLLNNVLEAARRNLTPDLLEISFYPVEVPPDMSLWNAMGPFWEPTPPEVQHREIEDLKQEYEEEMRHIMEGI